MIAALPDVIGQTIGNLIVAGAQHQQEVDASKPADIVADLKNIADNFNGGPSDDPIAEKLAELDAEDQIRQARAIEPTDGVKASQLQGEAIYDYFDKVLNDQGQVRFGAALDFISPQIPSSPSTADEDPTADTLQEVGVNGVQLGRAFGLLDRPGVWAGNLKERIDGQLGDFLEAHPAARDALSIVNVGLMIAGGPERFATGQFYDLFKGQLVQATTQRFEDVGYGDVTSAHGGQGLPWLGDLVLNGIKGGGAALAGYGVFAAFRRVGKRPAPEIPVAKGWSVGDDIYATTKTGAAPAWSTVRSRFWKNEAASPQHGTWNSRQLNRMTKGLAPQRYNLDKGGIESMDLSHEPIPFRAGGKAIIPRWPQDHAAVDPFRRPGY